ncbi:unnamed protein product [Citrullus colocynthis]|uniref:Uncharacterized protein n=1 Tax=Citrullus colocynthis TaxID=252529 RepID=A0ABP0Z0N0_9ROSI
MQMNLVHRVLLNGYDSTEVLMVSNKDIQNARIMDSRAGYSYKSEKGVLKVTKGSLVKLKGILRNHLYVLEEVRIDSEARPLVTLGESSDQSPLISQVESSQQSGSDSGQSQQERTLIDEGAFAKESSTDSIEVEPLTFEEAIVFDSKEQ